MRTTSGEGIFYTRCIKKMDKFVVRTPRQMSYNSSAASPKKRLTQATIESLPGVVVVEDIKRLRTILRVKDQTKEILLNSLAELDKKIPSHDVLKSTKIGHTIKRLTKHSDSDVASRAKSLVKKWTKHFEAKLNRPLLEVKSDHKTEELRNTARKHLCAAMECSPSDSLVKLIEQETFHQHQRLVSAPYRRTIRKIVFTLKHRPEVREGVLNRTFSVTELVREYKHSSKVS